MTELLPCPFCGSQAERISEGAITCSNSACPVVCGAPSQGYRSDYDPVASWNTRAVQHAQGAAEQEVQDTWLVGGPNLKAMSGSIESDRVIQLHFHRKVNDKDRAWLLEAINAKILFEREPDALNPAAAKPAQGESLRETLVATQTHLLKYTGGFAANAAEAALFAKIEAALASRSPAGCVDLRRSLIGIIYENSSPNMQDYAAQKQAGRMVDAILQKFNVRPK